MIRATILELKRKFHARHDQGSLIVGGKKKRKVGWHRWALGFKYMGLKDDREKKDDNRHWPWGTFELKHTKVGYRHDPPSWLFVAGCRRASVHPVDPVRQKTGVYLDRIAMQFQRAT